MSYTTRRSVLSGVRRQSGEGCERFYRFYAPLIRLHGRDCGVPESELDDLVQNVLFGFFRDRRFSYDSGKGRFRSYLRQMIRHRSADLLRDFYRRRRSDSAFVAEEEYLDCRYDEEWRDHVRDESLRRLRFQVTPEHYQQFRMIAFERRDAKSVAGFYHVPVSSVYSAFNRTRGVMRRIVSEVEAESG